METFTPREQVSDVLRTVATIDWSRLHHLRGPATDVPPLLKMIALEGEGAPPSESRPEAEKHALRTLGLRILPFYDGIEGSVCELTSHVVPILARLAATGIRSAASILILLRRVAMVASDRDPYEGSTAFSVVAHRFLAPVGSPREARHSWQRASGIALGAASALYRHFHPSRAERLYGHRSQLALTASIPLFFQVLSHPSEDVRTAAVRLIERLAQSSSRPADLSLRIVSRLESERDEVVIAHLVLALGHTADSPARSLLEALLDAQDPLVRVLAAISFRPSASDGSPKKRLTLLVAALATASSGLAERYELATSRSLEADVGRALGESADDTRIIANLLLAVLSESRDREVPETVLELLLDTLFPNADAPVPATALTREQRLVLHRLSSDKVRSRDRDFTPKLAAKGLPTDPRTLARFVALN